MLASQIGGILPRSAYFTPVSILNLPQSKFRLFKHSKCKSYKPLINKKFNISPRNRIILKSFENDEFNERYSGFDSWTLEELELAITQLGFPIKGYHEKQQFINTLRRIVHFVLEDPFIQADGTVTSQQVDLQSLTYAEARRRLLKVGSSGIQNMRKTDMIFTLQQIYGKRKLAESMVYDQQKYLLNQQFQTPEEAEQELSEIMGEEQQFKSDVEYLLNQVRTKQLRQACEYRELPSHGKKVDLVKKLMELVVKEVDDGKLLPGLAEIEKDLFYIAGVPEGDEESQEAEEEEVKIAEEKPEEPKIAKKKAVSTKSEEQKAEELELENMRYNDLRLWLSSRGLKTMGKKIELIERGLEYIRQQYKQKQFQLEQENIQQIVENLSDEEIQNKLSEFDLEVLETREENVDLLKQTLHQQSELGVSAQRLLYKYNKLYKSIKVIDSPLLS